MHARDGLWAHADFRRLWAAQALSAFGSRITRTALPVVAINVLQASPIAIAVLSAASFVPQAFAGIFASGFVERTPKRSLMLAMDLVRFIILIVVPLAAWAGFLGFAILLVVAMLAGAATALFENADTAFLPALVGRARVIEGNSKLQATDSIAEIAGPGLAGILIDLLTAPIAILLDALTFLWSALWLWRIRHAASEPRPAPDGAATQGAAWAELRADLEVGWRAVWRPRPLRAAFLALAIYYVSSGFFLTLYMLLTLRVMGLSASTVGIVISVGGVGGLLGAAIAPRLVRAISFGPAILASLALGEVGLLLLLCAAAGAKPTLMFLVGHQLLGDAGGVAFMILATSLRQGMVPGDELARANGLFQIAGGFIVPLCALLAGLLADAIGVRWAAIIGIGSGLLAILPCLSPALLALRAAPGTGHL
jgi:MFS family permease